MEFKKISFLPIFCPKIFLPFWWVLVIIFYIFYIPLFVFIWLLLPSNRKKKSMITLQAEYRRDRH